MAQLHEHQAKEILAAHGIEIPRGQVAHSAKEAREIAESLGGSVVVKAQIHSTSRAAAGGIRFANSADEAEKIASEMIGREIAGNLCEAVLIDERAEIAREFYLGFIIDTQLKRPTLLFSDAGGSGIEERAASMKKFVCSIRREPDYQELQRFVFRAAFASLGEAWTANLPEEFKNFADGSDLIAARMTLNLGEILQKLYRAAVSCEARTAEINPLAFLKDGRLVALDARISVDDYAVFRHPDLPIEMARELGHTPTRLEKIAWEVEKDDFRGTFYFVEILNSGQWSVVSGQEKGENESQTTDHRPPTTDHFRIGFHGAGGGGSMASLDAAQRSGLQPACYVDTSGNPPASKVYRAARIILSIPGIRGYFLSGSGVASQEQFGLARAVLKAFLEVRPNIPAVLRLGGNGEEYAKELIEKYAARLPAPMEAYQKQHSADFCAARLYKLIEKFEPQRRRDAEKAENEDQRPKTEDRLYKFKTRTGEITYDHSVFENIDAAPIVEACPVKILKLDERRLPVLAITREEAERGKCIECLACEFASWEHETGGVKIDLPIEGIESLNH